MDTGFSYSDSGKRTKSVKECAQHLYELMDQFFKIFPDAKAKDLYICGESYAGKYAPELARLVRDDSKMNLKGLLLASGLMNPRLMLPRTSDLLESVGIMNQREVKEMNHSLERAFEQFKDNPRDAVMDIIKAIFRKLAELLGHEGTDNILYNKSNDWSLQTYLNQAEVQKAIHVKPMNFVTHNVSVIQDMAEDFLNDVTEVLQSLLESGFKVLVYNGQLDPAVSVPMIEEFLSTLEWSGKKEYVAGDSKVIWKDSDGVAIGYVTKAGNLTRVILRSAGHRTAIDQPQHVLDMVKRFVSDLPFEKVTGDHKTLVEPDIV